MKRKLSLMVLLAMFFNIFCSMPAVRGGEVAPPQSLKILIIANSFGVNASRYLYDIAKDCGIEDVIIGIMDIDGCSIDKHWANASGNIAAYRYKKNSTGTFEGSNACDKTMLYGIQDEEWDYIVTHQRCTYSPLAETYNSDLTNLVDYILANKTNPNGKMLWHMTWTQASGAVSSTYPDQATMYYEICEAVKNKVLPNPDISFVIPGGTAIQNGRTSYLGCDYFNSDTMHLNEYGSFTVDLAWIKKITGCSIDDVTFAPAGITPAEIAIAKEAANAAVANPYIITPSSYTPTPNPLATPTPTPIITPTPGPDGKIVVPLLQENFEKYAFWNEMTDSGWILGNAGAASIETFAPNIYNRYFNLGAGETAYKTFYPVPLNITAGKSPGKNAQLIVSYDAYIGAVSGSSQSFIKVDSPDSGLTVVSIGRRGGAGPPIRYAKVISASFTGITVLESMPKFTKIKFVTKFTDENGDFFPIGTNKVDIYAGDMQTPIVSGADVNMIDKYAKFADRFFIGGACPAAVDNIDISLVVDSDNMPETIVPLPTFPPDIDRTVLSARLVDAENLYCYASAHTGETSGLYPVSFVSALNSAITEAKEIYKNITSTSEQIAEQESTLYVAMDYSPGTLPTPTPTPTPIPTATPTPTPEPESADTTELSAKLEEANLLYNTANANIGTDGNQYQANRVTQLEDAIAAAQTVLNNIYVSQNDVDSALAVLVGAMENCITNAEATPTPSPTPTPQPGETIKTVLVNEDFEDYKTIADVTAEGTGWTLSTDLSPVLAAASGTYTNHLTLSATQNQYMSSAKITFAPVPVNPAGGKSPGKNAMLEFEWDAYGANMARIGFAAISTDSELTGTNNCVAKIITSRANSGNWYYSKDPLVTDDPTVASNLWTDGIPKFTKLKMEIHITDGNGDFLSAPIVKIYKNNLLVKTFNSFVSSKINYVDGFSANTYAKVGSNLAIDNLSINLYTDNEGIIITPTPEPTPVPVNKDDLYSAIVDAEDFYNYTVLASIGDLEGQYTQVAATALSSAIAAANNVYYDYLADQATVDQATSDLNAAVAATVANSATPTPEPQGVTVSGYTDAVGATVTLAEGVTIAADEAGYFEFTGVAAGSYSLAIAKQYHVTRTIAITVSDADIAIGTSENKVDLFKGDFTEDGSINVSDYQVFMLSYNKSTGADGFNPEADFTQDGSVNVSDYQVFMLSYNKSAASYVVWTAIV